MKNEPLVSAQGLTDTESVYSADFKPDECCRIGCPPRVPRHRALIYTALREKDRAFQWLDKAASERSTFLVYSKWEPQLDPLRSDPRFKELLNRIGLTA